MCNTCAYILHIYMCAWMSAHVQQISCLAWLFVFFFKKAEMLFLLHLGLFPYISFLFNNKLCSSSVDRSSLKVVKQVSFCIVPFNKPLVPLWDLWEPSPGTKPECGIHYVLPSAPCGALIWIPSTQKRALCHCRGF